MVKPLRSSAIRDLLRTTEQPHITSLAGGLPDPALFPVHELAATAAEALAEDPVGALQYGPTEGLGELRSWVAARYGTTVDRVRITSGSQQALDLLARTLLDAGDEVALAEPAYIGAIGAFAAADARFVALRSDHHGADPGSLADALARGHRPRLVYLVTEFDNPTGTTLAEDRRRAFADLAERHDLLLVDDDPYGALRWRGEAGPPLRAMTERVVTLGTTSKVLAPGLRVGWMAGPADALARTTILKQAADLHTGSLAQQVATRLLRAPGFLDAHLGRLRPAYRARADALANALAEAFGDRITFVRPDGGMFLWATLRDERGHPVDADALLALALLEGTAFVPGSAFAPDPGRAAALDGRMRLSFATEPPARLVDAVDRLRRADARLVPSSLGTA